MNVDCPIPAARARGMDFVELSARYETRLRRYARSLVRCYSLLHSPDEQDIYTQGLTKLWNAYFRRDAAQVCQFTSERQTLSLLKRALHSVAMDLLDSRRRECGLGLPLNVDDYAEGLLPTPTVLHSHDFANATILQLDFLNFVARLENEEHRLVALSLLDLAPADALAGRTPSYLRVTAMRLRRQFFAEQQAWPASKIVPY